MTQADSSLKGQLLLDGGNLAGSFFHRSVVLICHHDDQGAFGLMLNRSLGSNHGLKSALKLPEPLQNRPIYIGGPVQPGAMSFLWTDAFIEHNEVFPGVGMGHDLDELSERLQHYSPQRDFRLFSGYAGWSPGQLEDELQREAWLIHTPSQKLLFEQDPAKLWKHIMCQRGWEERLMAEAPEDLEAN